MPNPNDVYVYCHDCKKIIAICHDVNIASAVSTIYYEKTQHHHTVGTKEYIENAFPDIVLEPEKAVIMIVGGCASIAEKPAELAVEIHDYDVEGEWVKENPDCFTDIEGDDYQVLSFPATRIKFSASGDQCFTDVEIRYHNYYKCPHCNIEWEDSWDSMCDDRCPDCNAPISPYKSEEINEVLGWQPSPDNFPMAGLQDFEVYEDLEMGKGCHPEVKDWIEISVGMIEEPTIIPSDNEVVDIKQLKNIIIMYHDIAYNLDDDSTIDVGDCEHEHIIYMIQGGYIEGELIKADPKDHSNTIRGYWKIVNPAK